jgi:hypothetical protein
VNERNIFNRVCLLGCLLVIAVGVVKAQGLDFPVSASEADNKSLQNLYGTAGTPSGSAANCANDCCQADCRSGFFGGAEYQFIRPHFSEAVGFATVTDSLGPLGLDRRVSAHELDFDYESAFRLFLGYHLDDRADVRLSYRFLDTETFASGTAGPGQTIVDPFGNIGLTGSSIDTTASVQMNVFDLEYLRPMEFNCAGVAFLYSAGLRFADVNQFYDSAITSAASARISDGRFDVDFFGIGPYLSLTGETRHGACDQFSLFAKGAMAILVGRYDISTQVTVPGAVGSQDADRVRSVPVLESELGVAWRPTTRLQLSAGWLFQSWWNMGASGGTFDGERLPFAPVDTAFGGADDSDIMSFDGLFLRAELNY